jgi:NhaA family Na+:H+ antiporter
MHTDRAETKNGGLSKLFVEFFESEKAGGLLLVGCTLVSLIIANSSLGHAYKELWHYPIAGEGIEHWINDGLMAIFFLLIGLELEREVYQGELSSLKNALLPVAGALGGMLIPAGIFIFFNAGTPTQAGAGIPMATDIAFALGILSLLGSRVPASLKIFLTALAVIDDLGAIIIIALFYSKGIIVTNLLISLGIFGALLILNRLKVHNLIPYLIGGVVMWYYMLHSGVHASITGVLLAFSIPFSDGSEKSPSVILQHALHNLVNFIILPLFALANTAIAIGTGWYLPITQPIGAGIIAGLSLGKPLGILLFSWLAVKLRLSPLPADINWKYIGGAGLLGGIGFTMSIFITLLAFDDALTVDQAKIMVLIASLISGVAGFLVLKWAAVTDKKR